MNNDPEKVDIFLSGLENIILERYHHYEYLVKKKVCKLKKCLISDPNFDPFNVNLPAFKKTIEQIRKDIKILHFRRGKLIGNLHTSEGKIAGIIAYRLVKAHIINTSRLCNNGCKFKCLARLNIEIAIRIGCDYIHKKYLDLPEGIRQELVYTIRYRHVNQETLGLVFDTLMEVEGVCHTNESTKKIEK